MGILFNKNSRCKGSEARKSLKEFQKFTERQCGSVGPREQGGVKPEISPRNGKGHTPPPQSLVDLGKVWSLSWGEGGSY